MIHRAKFQNFKALRDVEVTFDSRLTVLVGPNGSGKTSVLQGVQFLGNYAVSEQAPRLFVIQDIPRFPGDSGLRKGFGWQELGTTYEITSLERDTKLSLIEVDSPNKPIFCRYLCRQDSTGLNEQTGADHDRHEFSIVEQLAASFPPTEQRISGDLPQLRRIRTATLLRLDTGKLASPSLPITPSPTVAKDGSGLPSAIAHLQRKHPASYRAVVSAFASVIPNVVDVRLDYHNLDGMFGDTLLFDFKGATGVPAASVSDGTLFVLGLLTIILNPSRPQLVLLDDLDHRLHPKAQMELVGVLRKLLTQFPDLQIIATSHSPYILNQLAWNEVRVTGLRDDGSAICARLEDHPEVERWREAMTPGEFWSHIGDDWVKKLDKTQTEQPQPAPVAL